MSRKDEDAITGAARRLLTALTEEGAWLAPIGEDAEKGAVRYGVYRAGAASPAMTVSSAFVEGLAARDLIAPDGRRPGAFEASAAAESLVRRLLAGADVWRAQHWSRAPTKEIEGAAAPFAAGDSPLAWLRKRRGADGRALISQAEYDAGERLRDDYEAAQMRPRLVGDWSAPRAGRVRRGPVEGLTDCERALAARQRVRRALESVGPQLGGVLVRVCCHLEGLEDAERAFGWPKRSGKVVLQLALDRLAAHYGYGETEGARGLRGWRGVDAKPAMFCDEAAEPDAATV